MKKILLPMLILCLHTISFAQVYGDDDSKADKEAKEIRKQKSDSIVSETGFIVRIGDKLDIGRGSQPDGDFRHITRNQTGFGAIMTASTDAKKNNEIFSLNRNNKGNIATVVKFIKRNSYTIPLVTLKNGATTRWEIDLDAAIESGELDVPPAFRPQKKADTQTVIVQQQTSVADELLKLKKLMDDGILTKDEFESQKKKLLEK